jgi:hypothetical protein
VRPLVRKTRKKRPAVTMRRRIVREASSCLLVDVGGCLPNGADSMADRHSRVTRQPVSEAEFYASAYSSMCRCSEMSTKSRVETLGF